MNRKSKYIGISILEKLYVITFLLLFLNVSLVNQYIDFESLVNSTIEFYEDDESEEKEVKEEIDEVFYELYITFLDLSEDELRHKSTDRSVSLLIAYHIDIFTPPPELV